MLLEEPKGKIGNSDFDVVLPPPSPPPEGQHVNTQHLMELTQAYFVNIGWAGGWQHSANKMTELKVSN